MSTKRLRLLQPNSDLLEDRECTQCKFYGIAIEKGHLACLKHLYLESLDWERWTCDKIGVLETAARYGRLDCMKFAFNNGATWINLSGYHATTSAAIYGHFDCLCFAFEKGCQYDHLTTHFAAQFGHLDCLQYARDCGCPWNYSDILYAAAAKGHLECLRYIYNTEPKHRRRTLNYSKKENEIFYYTNFIAFNFLTFSFVDYRKEVNKVYIKELFKTSPKEILNFLKDHIDYDSSLQYLVEDKKWYDCRRWFEGDRHKSHQYIQLV